ncbi:MAG: hypothetical protein MI741_16100, partial [Rhodospirillales bacterium]|nr:hypothetical protein [Rhodospirillales bacterium]
QVPEAAETWTIEAKAQRPEFQPPWYYLGLIGLVAPWPLWLIAGLIQPFMRAKGERRRQLLFAWIWFIVIFIFFSIPGTKQQRYILPIIPAAALLIGQVFSDHQRVGNAGGRDMDAKLLITLHWVGLILLSMLFAPVMIGQAAIAGWIEGASAMLVHWGWLNAALDVEADFIGPIEPLVVFAGGIALIALSWFGAWSAYQWKAMRAGVVTSVWMIVFMSIYWHAYGGAADGRHPVRPEAERVAAAVGDVPVYYLRLPENDLLVNEEFLLYSRRIMPKVRPDDLAELETGATESETIYLVAPMEMNVDVLLKQRGWKISLPEVLEDPKSEGGIWVRVWRYGGG